jgi:O-antigen/teichoic acid export membrane protein
MAIGLLLAAPWLAEQLLKAPELDKSLMIAALAVLFGTVNGYQTGALAGMESYRPLALVAIMQAFLYLVFCAAGTWLGGIDGAIAAVALSSFVRWLLLAHTLERETARCGIPRGDARFGRERDILWRFALPVASGAIIGLPAVWIGQALLARQPEGYAELAIYTAATHLRLMVMFAPSMLNNVGMAILNNQVGANDNRRYQHLFWVVLLATAFTVSVGAIAVGFLGPWLLSLFGSGFAEGSWVLKILLLSTIVESIAVAANQITVSHEKMWLSLLCIGIPRDCSMVLLAWLLTPTYGASGLAAAYLLAWCICLVLIVLIVARLGLKVPMTANRRAVTPAS